MSPTSLGTYTYMPTPTGIHTHTIKNKFQNQLDNDGDVANIVEYLPIPGFNS